MQGLNPGEPHRWAFQQHANLHHIATKIRSHQEARLQKCSALLVLVSRSSDSAWNEGAQLHIGFVSCHFGLTSVRLITAKHIRSGRGVQVRCRGSQILGQ